MKSVLVFLAKIVLIAYPTLLPAVGHTSRGKTESIANSLPAPLNLSMLQWHTYETAYQIHFVKVYQWFLVSDKSDIASNFAYTSDLFSQTTCVVFLEGKGKKMVCRGPLSHNVLN